MILATDSIFVTAVKSNSELVEIVDGRIYGTAIPVPDEDIDNVPVPYVILTFDGLNNDTGTKDDRFESEYDHVNIGVEIAADTLENLHNLTKMVRETILGYFRENETAVEDYTFSADAIQYDSLRPCYWQALRYQCDVYNLEDDEQENEQENG
ncbi:MAG: hypothetical protein IKG25_02845 [Mogibacterium sp.]|nr:hypothetical protein [Mogibacterium sp.]